MAFSLSGEFEYNVGMRHLGLGVVVVLLAAGGLGAQGPAFEVASVRLVEQAQMQACFTRGNPAEIFNTKTAGRVSNCSLLLIYIQQAYGLTKSAYLLANPEKVPNILVNLDATAAPGATPDELNAMLRNLLAERFHLKTHTETRTADSYELSLAKSGHKLKENDELPKDLTRDDIQARLSSTLASVKPAAGDLPQLPAIPGKVVFTMGGDTRQMRGTNVPMSELTRVLGSNLKAPVADLTGLEGRYDFTLAYSDMVAPATAETGLVVSLPSLPGALRDQLGLSIEKKKSMQEFLVIDSVDAKPTEN
jgi:uncharacterized protein (TIGR03435 family)